MIQITTWPARFRSGLLGAAVHATLVQRHALPLRVGRTAQVAHVLAGLGVDGHVALQLRAVRLRQWGCRCTLLGVGNMQWQRLQSNVCCGGRRRRGVVPCGSDACITGLDVLLDSSAAPAACNQQQLQ